MNKNVIIKLPAFMLLWISLLAGNSIVRYKVYISHPLFGKEEKPLIITEVIEWHHGTVDSVITKFYPLKVRQKVFVNGKESFGEGGKRSWTEYFDAFILPDSMGYILIKVRIEYESFSFLSIEKWREGAPEWKIKNPPGNEILWSKDGKYLVTGLISYWGSFPKIWFYDLNTGRRVKEMKFGTWEDFEKYVKRYLIRVKAW